MVTETETDSKRVLIVSAALGLAACSALLWLLYGRSPQDLPSERLMWLPAFNAVCNALSAACLVAGFAAIRERRVSTHMRWMLSALGFSTFFLIGYLTHHAIHGDTKFGGAGIVRPVYFSILISHVALSVVALPLILSTVWFAATSRFTTHSRIARITLPVWLYVSVTGVVVYLFLRAYR